MPNKPRTLDECMTALTEVLSPEDQVDFLKASANDLIMYHHDLGRWIRNNWGLWEPDAEKSPLLKHMKELGFIHPDDMSQAIITEFWNRMNNQPSELEKDIEKSVKYWKEIKDGS
jgi:hypothetical protein